MKIAVISPNPQHLGEISQMLQAPDGRRTIVSVEGGMNRLRQVADQQQPDIVIVDGMCRDSGELGEIEYLGLHHPQAMAIMLCANQSPEFLINAMRAGVREVLPTPVSREALEAAVLRFEQRQGQARPRQPGRILAFIPCKGGSGATFLAANTAHALASEGKKTLLIDLNLQFGDAVLFVHDDRPPANLADVARNIQRLDAAFLAASQVSISANFGVLAAPEDPGQVMEIKPEHIEALLNLAVNQYDFVVLDVGRVLDVVSIKALDHAHRIFPVLQATLPFIRDASRLLKAFHALGYAREKIGLVMNRYEKGEDIQVADVERSLGMAVFKTIPNSFQAVASAVNIGKPLAEVARTNPVARQVRDFARELSKPGEEEGSLMGRLLRRA